MLARTHNASQLLRKSVTTCVDETPSMRKTTQMYLTPCCPWALYFSEDTKSIWTCVHQTHSMTARTLRSFVDQRCMPAETQNTPQHGLTKPLFQASDEQKSTPNCISTRKEHAGEYTKCNSTCDRQSIRCHPEQKGISTCVDQSPQMPAWIQKAYQYAKSNPLICQGGHKMNLNIYVLNKPSHVSEGRIFIATCVD